MNRRIDEKIRKHAEAGDIAWLIEAVGAEGNLAKSLGAYHALVKLGDAAAGPLRAATSSREPTLRISAVTALAELGEPDADELLVRELRAFDFGWLPGPRYFLWEGLASWAGQRRVRSAVPVLCAALAEGSDITSDAADALAEIGDESATDSLIDALREADPYEALALSNALRRLGRADGIAAIDDWVRRNPEHAGLVR